MLRPIKCTLLPLRPTSTRFSSTCSKVIDARSKSLHATLLSSPLRRCLLTQRVMPQPFLVKLKAVTTSPDSTKQLLVPELLHERFSPRLVGRSAYVLCRSDTVKILRQRGSYKRLSPSATMPDYTTTRIGVDLHRRVVQECRLLSERLKSAIEKSICPIVPITEDNEALLGSPDWDGTLDGNRPAAILRFRPNETTTTTSTIPHLMNSTQVPVYDLSNIDSLPLPPPPEGSPPLPPLSAQICRSFDSSIGVYARANGSKSRKHLDLAAYAILAGDRETLPLLVALWRLRLWSGQGWTELGRKTRG